MRKVVEFSRTKILPQPSDKIYPTVISTLMNCLQIFADTETHDNGSILNLLSPSLLCMIYDLPIFHVRDLVWCLALRKYFRFFICWVEIKWRKLKEFLWEIIGDKWNKCAWQNEIKVWLIYICFLTENTLLTVDKRFCDLRNIIDQERIMKRVPNIDFSISIFINIFIYLWKKNYERL